MKLFGILIFVCIFTQCASVKLNDDLPFSIKKASYTIVNNTVYNSNLIIEFTSDEIVDFKKVYFQDKIMNPIIEHKMDKKYIIAHHNSSINQDKKDFVLNADSQKEYGNTAPKINKKSPFNLNDNEAIISYKIADKIYTYKIKNISKKTN
ncbi:hypothetical protein PG913_12705 [Tenacibaculum pacificus]|uniref:hypothetical protein n=1 Tax=Tenacibaculum pacificus TaxID=3018314 RepID=UPI0022F3C9A1|nr:hypothetical protein [Tenacibaculum pacificus]WBX73667.1 hypothetical protein PG913_12705 [Tenacibaculum pacificus]